MKKKSAKKIRIVKPKKSVRNRSQRRMIFAFSIISIIFIVLAGRIGWVSVIAGDLYAQKAAEAQTRDESIQPKRGAILDRNMTELATSAVTYRIWVRPKTVIGSDESTELQWAQREKAVKMLSEELEMAPDVVRDLISQDKVLVRTAKDVKKDVMERIQERSKKEEIYGIEIVKDTSRYYPFGSFASHIIGTVDDDGNGRSGIELAYNENMSGMAGRWLKNTDASGNLLAYGTGRLYDVQNGLNVILTIDEAIQHYLEKTVKEVSEEFGAARVMGLVMDIKSGEMLAMGMTPDYDLNNPMTPTTPELAEYINGLDEEERMEQLNKMWRNPMVSDTYDPGSTFKLITVSAALEERVTRPDEGGFRCSGHYPVANTSIRCWRYYNPHGLQTVTQAVGNSCNPVMVQLAQRMGYDNFYKYIERFGFTGTTGLDFPGEGTALIQSRKQAGQLGLASMAFGQGISVTPIQLVTAISALGNGGKLMQPRLVKGFANEDGIVTTEFAPKVVRQVVSEQTASEILGIMETTINTNIKVARIPGYRIGGKSGTAEKLYNGSYKSGKVVSSMFLMAPMDDPQISLLIIVDEPDNSLGEVFGSTVAAPGAKSLMIDILRYLNIAPAFTDEELAAMEKEYIETPDVIGMNISEAADLILGEELTYRISPLNRYYADFTVVDQYPKAGERIKRGRQIVLYKE